MQALVDGLETHEFDRRREFRRLQPIALLSWSRHDREAGPRRLDSLASIGDCTFACAGCNVCSSPLWALLIPRRSVAPAPGLNAVVLSGRPTASNNELMAIFICRAPTAIARAFRRESCSTQARRRFRRCCLKRHHPPKIAGVVSGAHGPSSSRQCPTALFFQRPAAQLLNHRLLTAQYLRSSHDGW